MKLSTPLAPLTLVAILGATLLTGTAGATDQLADNMVEGQTYSIQADDGVTLADHQTDHLSWNDALANGEIQPLGQSWTAVNGVITFTLTEHADCSNHQLDLITGEPLSQVDPGSRNRYNRIPFGGTSRLLSAVYVAASDTCGQTPDTTTTTEVLTPATVPTTPTTITVERTTPIPPALTTTTISQVVEVDVPLILEPTPTTITEFVAPAAPPMLPVTGVDTGLIALLGAITGLGGISAMFAARFLQRRNLKNNAS